MPSKIAKPDRDCPKCGDRSWTNPRFRPVSFTRHGGAGAPPAQVPEAILFQCGTCGYEQEVPPLDKSQE